MKKALTGTDTVNKLSDSDKPANGRISIVDPRAHGFLSPTGLCTLRGAGICPPIFFSYLRCLMNKSDSKVAVRREFHELFLASVLMSLLIVSLL